MNRTVALQVEQRYKQCTETVDDDNPRMADPLISEARIKSDLDNNLA